MNWKQIAYDHGFYLGLHGHNKRAGWCGERYEDFCRGHHDGEIKKAEIDLAHHRAAMAERDPFEDGFNDGVKGVNVWHSHWGRCAGPLFMAYKRGHEIGCKHMRLNTIVRVPPDFGLSNHIRLMREQVEIMKSQQIEVTVGGKPETPQLTLNTATPGYYEMFTSRDITAPWTPVIITRTNAGHNIAINLNNPAASYQPANWGTNPVRIPKSPLEVKVTF
jgi:hypothetical protein